MNWKSIYVPIYDFNTHKRSQKTQIINPSDIIFFEGVFHIIIIVFLNYILILIGIFGLYDRRIRDMMTFKMFVICDDDVRLSRRILRDIKERGRDAEGVLNQYNKFVKPSYQVIIHKIILKIGIC
jgi:uridine kinase